MKTILLILSTTMLYTTASAQSNKVDSVFWDNGNVSLLSDIAPVWIILKKGSDLKDVRIREIKKEKGIIVYEKEKTLHDVYIHNIKKIQAGKYSLQNMFFYADNTPYIKADYLQMDAMLTYSTFKFVKAPVQVITKEEEVIAKQPKVETIVTTKFDNTSRLCDTIIDAYGKITLALIISIDTKFISYRRLALPDGPIYIKSNTNTTITRYSKCMSIKFSNP